MASSLKYYCPYATISLFYATLRIVDVTALEILRLRFVYLDDCQLIAITPYVLLSELEDIC